MKEVQDYINGIKHHQVIRNKYLNKGKKVLLFLLLFICNYFNGYTQIIFSKENWEKDHEIDSLMINSYRAYIVDSGLLWDIVKGQTKKQIIQALGNPDFVIKGKEKKGTYSSLVYCIGKEPVDKKCKQCKGASISIILNKGVAIDLIRVFSGG